MLALLLLLSTPPGLGTQPLPGAGGWIQGSRSPDDFKRQKLLDSLSQSPAEAERREAMRIQALAKQGDVRAMRMTGTMLMHGLFQVKQDQEAALGWFYEAAIRGDAQAMFSLGCAFQQGTGTASDPKLAAFWLAQAASGGLSRTCD